jgi:hypothetical protein
LNLPESWKKTTTFPSASGYADAARDLEQNVQRVLESLTVCG